MSCPVCGASAKGKNLGKHPGASGGTTWRSRDKRIRRPFLTALVLGLAAAAAAVFAADRDAGMVVPFVVVLLGLMLTGDFVALQLCLHDAGLLRPRG